MLERLTSLEKSLQSIQWHATCDLKKSREYFLQRKTKRNILKGTETFFFKRGKQKPT